MAPLSSIGTLILTGLSLHGIATAAAVLPRSNQKVSLAGVQLFGLANDASVLGSAYSLFEGTNCNASHAAYPYYDPPEHYYEWRKLGFNLFRIPAAWQHLQTSLNGDLNHTTIQALDKLVNVITRDGSTAILDVHNYARYYCSIIGQPENDLPSLSESVVTDENFVNLWKKLATHYRHNEQVMFQLMNEPHDLNITKWARTSQKAIDAIRSVGAKNEILISGTQFARLTNWEDYSMAALSTVTDPLNKLLYDFHQYFDDDGGAYGVCEPWTAFLPTFQRVTNFLRGSGARGIMTEFGGSPVQSCATLFEGLLTFFEVNNDVWAGWTAWGSFNPGDLYLSLDKKSPFYLLTAILKSHAPSS